MQKKYNKAYIHIGTPKTGTTSVQHFCNKNRDALKLHKVFYPITPGSKNHRKLSAYTFGRDKFDNFHKNNFIDTIDKKIIFENEFTQEFTNELEEDTECNKLLISSEQFYARSKEKSELLKLKALIDPYVEEYRIIVYLRPQIDQIVSGYSTVLKSGGTIQLTEYIQKMGQSKNKNYYNSLLRWEEIFGEDSLSVRLYDKKKFRHENLIDDFLEAININSSEMFKFSQNKNQSLSVKGQKLFRILNKYIVPFIPEVGYNKKHQYLKKLIEKYFIGQGEKPKYNFAKQIQEKFDESNEKVRKKWFPDKEILFDIDWTKYPKS